MYEKYKNSSNEAQCLQSGHNASSPTDARCIPLWKRLDSESAALEVLETLSVQYLLSR